MKELTIEQKAKAYDEAIKKFRPIYDLAKEQNRTIDVEEFESIFPELKESEDENIRKKLIENFKWFCGDYPETSKWGKDDDLFVKDIIAWLEKQGKQKPVFEIKTPEESLGIDSNTYNNIVDECIYGEQKPAWSEEDEQMLGKCIDAASGYYSPEDKQSMKDWLKSLRPHSNITDEELIEKVVKHIDGLIEFLNEFGHQLKKERIIEDFKKYVKGE